MCFEIKLKYFWKITFFETDFLLKFPENSSNSHTCYIIQNSYYIFSLKNIITHMTFNKKYWLLLHISKYKLLAITQYYTTRKNQCYSMETWSSSLTYSTSEDTKRAFSLKKMRFRPEKRVAEVANGDELIRKVGIFSCKSIRHVRVVIFLRILALVNVRSSFFATLLR